MESGNRVGSGAGCVPVLAIHLDLVMRHRGQKLHVRIAVRRKLPRGDRADTLQHKGRSPKRAPLALHPQRYCGFAEHV